MVGWEVWVLRAFHRAYVFFPCPCTLGEGALNCRQGSSESGRTFVILWICRFRVSAAVPRLLCLVLWMPNEKMGITTVSEHIAKIRVQLPQDGF